MAPVAELYVPSGHGVHGDVLVESLKEPAAQGAQPS
jgi:hypothetical protein